MNSARITRLRKGKSFVYYQDDKHIDSKNIIDWIKSLAIPPAWKDVTISPSPNAKILARGRDKAGRLQAIYNPSFRAKREAEKYSKILDFAARLPKLRKQIEHDLALRNLSKKKVLACIVKLIDMAYFRVGNTQYAKENESYGITTMRSKHVDVNSYSVTFDFKGKSGKHHVKKINDRTLARIIQQLDELPGYELFKYKDENGQLHTVSSTDVNDYIRKHMGGDFTAKDFRTWGGTLHAIEVLMIAQATETKKERQKTITACVKKVARRLGNTPAIARASYIDPRIFDRYLNGEDYNKIKQTVSKLKHSKYISPEESCALKILKVKN